MNLRKTQTCHLMKIGIFIEIGYLINKIMQKIGEKIFITMQILNQGSFDKSSSFKNIFKLQI